MLRRSGYGLASFMLIGVLFSASVDTAGAYTIMGNVVSYEKDGCNITFNCENGKVRLSFLTEGIVRVHMAPAGKDFPKDTLHLEDNGHLFAGQNENRGVCQRVKRRIRAVGPF